MRLFNSKSNKTEEFIPIKENHVSLYVCGPTVYNHAHIGNARPIVVFDLLRRVFEALDYHVHFVSNFTDIDDKIIHKAIEEMTSEKEIADRYIQAYEEVRSGLHASNVDAKPRVTQVIQDIIEFIQALIEKGYAYEVHGDVYFRVLKVESYGSISHQKLDELRVGARIEENEDKENPLDFVLWKKADDQGIAWDSPWGKGRPGWHTECVVMIHNAFGPKIDIHGGGQDLRFPHHENESAQAYALFEHDIANYWVHNAMLQIDGEKMSKSLGNVVWAKDYIETLGSNVTRWLLLSTHYRLVLNISDDTIEQSVNEIKRFESSLRQVQVKLQLLNEDFKGEINKKIQDTFLDALKDDLNVANALVVLYEALKELNTAQRARDLNLNLIKDLFVTITWMLELLGIYIPEVLLSEKDKELYHRWETFKKEKNFDEADKLRAQLIEKGLL